MDSREIEDSYGLMDDHEQLSGMDKQTHSFSTGHDDLFQLTTLKFQSRDDLLNSVRNSVSIQGYSISIKKSKRDRYVIIGCDRGGMYRNRRNISEEQRQRKIASRLINCPFEVQGKRKVDGSWILELRNETHNHEPSSEMSKQPSCRHFSKEEILRIKEMTMSGVPPRQILSLLKQSNPDLPAVSKTVYNMKAKIRRHNLSGRAVIDALVEELSESGFTFKIEYQPDGHLSHLLFSHPKAIALSKIYSNIFFMDSTYKNNKYKMTFLSIIGMSSFNSPFYSCFIFLRKEEIEDYVWALRAFGGMLGVHCQPLVVISNRELTLMKAIEFVFPASVNLLGRWHLENGIVSYCKPYFEDEHGWNTFLSAWNIVINSLNESIFYEAWQHFEILYRDREIVFGYILTTWLPFKDRFVSAWIEKHRHFGNCISSRAERAHVLLKKYLKIYAGDLSEVKNKIFRAIDNQFQEIKAQFSSEKVRTPRSFTTPFFRELVTQVSIFALRQLFKQYELAVLDKMLPECKGHFMSVMGLPCAHIMRERKNEGLRLNDIHEQWRLDLLSVDQFEVVLDNDEDEIRRMLEEFYRIYKKLPLARKDVARKQLSQLVNNIVDCTEEIPFQPFKARSLAPRNRGTPHCSGEDSELLDFTEKSRKCRVCKCVGHNSRTCQNKTELTEQSPNGTALSLSWEST